MRRTILLASGWIAAAIFAALAVVRLTARGDAAVEPENKVVPKVVSPAPSGEIPDVEPPQEAEVPEPETETCVQPGDDWEPPGTIRSPEGLYAFLCNASRADRALADCILAARKSGDKAALLSAADNALRSSEPKVRAMAVAALVEMAAGVEGLSRMTFFNFSRKDWAEDRRKAMFTPEEERTRTGLLLAFSGDDNDYVRKKAGDGFIDALASTCDFDVARDLSAAALDALDSGKCGFPDHMLCVAMTTALGVDMNELDSGRFEMGMRTMFEIAGRKDGEKVQDVSSLLSYLTDDGDGDVANILKDSDMMERVVARRKAVLDDGLARFPDDNAARNTYVNAVESISRSAKERFGDAHSEKAQTWIAEMKTLLTKRLAERDRSKPIADAHKLLP